MPQGVQGCWCRREAVAPAEWGRWMQRAPGRRGVALWILGVSASCVGPPAQQGLHGNQALGFRGNSRAGPGNAAQEGRPQL